jgi:glycopeptide antibiotics resistance protein
MKKSLGSFQSVNLIPFYTIVNYMFNDNLLISTFALSNILGNVLLFVPLGIYVTLLNRNKSILVNTLLVTLCSVLVEVAQYALAVGSADIDDVIVNTIGGLIGVLLYRVIISLFKEKTRLAIAIIAPIGGIFAFVVLTIVNG